MNEFRDTPIESAAAEKRAESAEMPPGRQSPLAASAANDYLSPSSQPSFYKSIADGYPIGPGSRVLLVLWSLFLCGGFLLAASMKPDPRGYGTHQSLGFPPCTFQVLFNIPCPSCGMTTSFSHFTRGEFVPAARANIAGLMLAVTCFIQIPWCWISAAKGRLWRVREPANFTLVVVGSIALVALTNWAWQLF